MAQPMTLDEVKAAGAQPLTAEQARALVTGAKADFMLVNGSNRTWSHDADGSFISSRNTGRSTRRVGRGKWSVRDDGVYCLEFDWGGMETDSLCRLLYPVGDRYYAFDPAAKGGTQSGVYRFKR